MELVTGVMGSLLPKLGELLKDEYDLQRGLREKIKSLSRELESVHAVLRKVGAVPSDQIDELVKLWARDVRELSYDMEDIVDMFFVRFNDGHESDDPRPVSIDPRLQALYKRSTELIGVDGPMDKIINMLSPWNDIHLSDKKKIISIVGFGGLGKTTLAKAVYDKLKPDFDCGAFVSVGRNPDMEKVLRDILIDLDKQKYKHSIIMTLNERQLINEIKDLVEKKRLAGAQGKCLNIPPAVACEKILNKCHSVPLAITTIASLLVNKPEEDWSEVYNSIGFGHEGNNDVENTRRILSFSYYDLPSHLKACLLYLSIFSEDVEIDKNILIWKWIAEGFVQDEQAAGVELFELGEGCFNELINRNMIMPVEVQYQGYQSKARYNEGKKNFVTLVDSYEQVELPLSHARRSLYHLRYLGLVNAEITELPKEVGDLMFLQTLDLRETSILELPESVGLLTQLLCLYVDHRTWAPVDLIGKLTSLQELCIRPAYAYDRFYDDKANGMRQFVKALGRLGELRVLQTQIDILDDSMEKDLLESLDNLHTLVSFKHTSNAGYFQKLKSFKIVGSSVRFDLSGCDIESSFMPSLETFETDVHVRFLKDANMLGFDKLGLENLPSSLKRIIVVICCRDASDAEVEEAQAALEHATDSHANSPKLTIMRYGVQIKRPL
uniref:NB-ARC domain-containing protein n=1 Tax=Oryza nivara TaxID=4536 RepID=A0A0E0HSF5_ORYNI